MGQIRDPLAIQCHEVGRNWIKSKDVVVQDVGARLLAVLDDVYLEPQVSEHAPPMGMVPDELLHYPWKEMPMLAASEGQQKAPIKQLVWKEAEENSRFGLRLGIVWISPEHHYPRHKYERLAVFYQMTGTLQLFQDDQDLALPAGTTHVHLPQVWLGHQNPAEPTLSFWVERVLEVEEVPRVIKDLYEMSFDAVTLALKQAMHQWLLSEDSEAQNFGKALLLQLKPRSQLLEPEPGWRPPDAQVTPPPAGSVSEGFDSCNWYLTTLDDPEHPNLKYMRECVFVKTETCMFGLFYVPGNLWYKAHSHAPKEIYHVIDGEALLLLEGDENGQLFGPNTFRVHQPFQTHAMQTFDRPALILWVWSGNLDWRHVDYQVLPGLLEELRISKETGL